MMFRYLGRFAVLAVCLFAIVIVMVGCGADEDDPPPPPPEETPMEKLTGTYSFVERIRVYNEEVHESPVSGKLHLRPGGNSWIATYEWEAGDSSGRSGPTWTADATTITLIYSDGFRLVQEYTLEGKLLTLILFDSDGQSTLTQTDKWRKE